MQAIVLSVGTELLLGEITDTNAQYISARFRDTGIDVYKRITVGDNLTRLTAAFKEALGSSHIVIATGGLGPTDDDLTAQALSSALGRSLEFHEGAWQGMLPWFKRGGRVPAESDRKQAMVVQGGFPLPNRHGTAPGQAVLVGKGLAAILPGPPREMVPMFEEEVLPLVKEKTPGLVPLARLELKLAGITEAKIGETVRDLMECANPSLAPYAGALEVRLRIAARGPSPEEASAMVSRVEDEVRRRLGDFIYGTDSDTLESVCGKYLVKTGATLAVAESVTGGLVAHKITQVPGSSRYFRLGVVAYHPSVKASCLGVPEDAAAGNGGVNPRVARAMAEGVRAVAGTAIGLATTGFAGPGGGTPDEPVGTVHTGIAYEGGSDVDRQVFVGSRATVKEYGAQRALHVLWRYLRDLK
jgi:nicotinamide-nucleotide amidase